MFYCAFTIIYIVALLQSSILLHNSYFQPPLIVFELISKGVTTFWLCDGSSLFCRGWK